jgi:multidrug efflux pump subunit AcrB
MNGPIAWFVENRVAANLLMVLILGAGALAIPKIKREVFPEFDPELISITVPYLGAAPEEVEDGVCTRIEESIQGLVGVKTITSKAAEGLAVVMVEVIEGADPRELVNDIKNRVDAIPSLPDESETPIVQRVIVKRQVINIAVSGLASEKTLKRIGEQVRDEVAALPGITQAELVNARPYEISVEISEEALRRYTLTFDGVTQAIRRSSLDLPGGSIRTKSGEILLRSEGQAYVGRDFERLVLLTNPDGTRITLGDIATVVDGFSESDESSRFDGNPSVLVQVFRVGNQSAIEVSEQVHEYLIEANTRVPEGIQLTAWQDDSEVLVSRLDLLMRNGRVGLVLVILSLTLFLRLGLAFWASLGIPVSFLGALMLMPSLDVSINLVSLFAFIVVLGIVVDDAIIVGENIHRYVEAGIPLKEAAVRGARGVLVPVVFAVLTTIVAFAPLLFIEGAFGQIFRPIPIVVIATLIFSLVESLYILPAHLSRLQTKPLTYIGRIWNHFQGGVAGLLISFRQRCYIPLLEVALRWRYLTIATGVATLTLSLGIWFGGWLKFSFLPELEADNVVALLTMPQGTPKEVTAAVLLHLEKSAEEVRDEVESSGENIFRHILTSLGTQPIHARQGPTAGNLVGGAGSHLGEVNIQLASSEERNFSSKDVADLWREKTGLVPDALELTFTSSLINSGEDINIRLTSPSLDALEVAAGDLKTQLGQYVGVSDISDSLREGKKEVKLKVLPAAETLGFTLFDLSRQVRQAFYGEEAQRIQRGTEEVKVMVRYPTKERRSLDSLKQMRVRSPAGDEVPFSTVAVSELGRGPESINRVDRQRAVTITANVDETRNNANEIISDLEMDYLPRLSQKHIGLRYSFEGEQKNQWETLSSLREGFTVAILLIFALLAIPLRSYIQPLIIMSVIPFGFVGAIIGHLIMGLNLTIISIFGIVALAGVVVNDSLVLVDHINQRRKEGWLLEDSVREAGRSRFRPILLTSVTTFLGLTPLIIEKSIQAQFLIPMAVSLAFGVLFSTFIVLLLLPAAYLVMEDILGLSDSIFSKKGLYESLH